MAQAYDDGWRDALAKVCEEYGGDPLDEDWHTPRGIANIINGLSGLARVNWIKGWNAGVAAQQRADDDQA